MQRGQPTVIVHVLVVALAGLCTLAFTELACAASSLAWSEAPAEETPTEQGGDSGSPFSEGEETESDGGEDDDRDDFEDHAVVHTVEGARVRHGHEHPRAPAAIALSDHPLAEPPTPPPRA